MKTSLLKTRLIIVMSNTVPARECQHEIRVCMNCLMMIPQDSKHIAKCSAIYQLCLT